MKIHNVSQNFKALALSIVAITTLSSLVFFFISFRQHQKSSLEKYSAINSYVVNNHKIFLDSIQKQAELLGQKIVESKLTKEPQINQILNRKLSLSLDLDTSISSNWIRFNWVEKDKIENFEYDLSQSIESPWLIKFNSLHSTSTDTKDHFLPISFAVTNGGDLVGVLTGKINILDLVKFLKSGIEDETINIAILDEDHNVISRPVDDNLTLPSNFFKDVNFQEKEGVINKNFKLTNATYLTYQKVKSYPFTIVVGNDEKKIFQPFYNSFRNYLLTFAIAIAIILMLLWLLYARIISPINNLETDIQELLKSHKLKNKISDEKNRGQKISCLNKVLDNALLITYPEIYSKEITINRYIAEDIMSPEERCNFAIDELTMTNILSTIISFSAKFSDRNSQININTKTNSDGDLHIEIEDFGHGDEEWRRNNCGNKLEEILLIDQLIKSNDGEIGYINKDQGVRYFIILHSEKKADSKPTQSQSNVIMFPGPKK